MQTKLLINGALVAGEGESHAVYNPSQGNVLVRITEASGAQVHAAVQSADAAFDAWSQTPPKDRAALLLKLAERIDAQAHVFARLEADNCGKPFNAVLLDELPAVSDVFRFFAGAVRCLQGSAAGEYVAGHTSMIRRDAVGVVASIAPWNYPLLMAAWKLGPALAGGNTVVLKPSEHTPLSTLKLGELLAEIFPAGVVNIVHGRGASVGEPLTSHAQVRMVSLTGSVRTGSRIIEGTAESVKRMHMELGGKAPVLIFDDADIDAAVEGIRAFGFYNASAMSYFDVRIPGLKMTVVAADGQHVEPVSVDELRIAVAETYDVIVEPGGERAYTLFAQSMDRSGYARGTLALAEGLSAPVPTPDPRPLIGMDDMGMGGMDHGAMGHGAATRPASEMDHSKMSGMDMNGMDHSKMAGMDMNGMDHSKMAGMDMNGMDHSKMADMDHSRMGMDTMPMQSHPASEDGNPLVDMQTMTPTPKLADPGLGLRDNGRRVLTYADLRSRFADPDGREPGRTIELHLTGHMEKFAWSFDGIKFSDAEPLRLTYGERLRIVLVNDTMMTHPIHLHGMWSDLEDEQGNFLVRKHTIDMPPGTRRSYRVTADALGRWAYHCHLLFHMEMGMFREVRVDEGDNA